MTAPVKSASTGTATPRSNAAAGSATSSPVVETPFAGAESIVGEARQKWVAQARCREIDPDELFVKGAAQRQAAAICRHCPVLLQCRADALDNRVEFGVWGGMTERQRRALLKQHPDVTSWADFYAEQLDRATARAQARASGE
ncbi:WhiB family transcriptional regulator [Dietzia sp.]|uniref:WhiB family transcriptional regulator n=1 Tax=Dietzia sp. TaxID=1871616 RepID=UPI002FD9BCB4